MFLRHVGDPGFQIGLGENMGIRLQNICYRMEAIVVKADTWIQFPVDPADFQLRLPKTIGKISLHFYAQSVYLTAHMCKFSNQDSTEMNIFVVKDLQPLMFRQFVMLLKDLQVFRKLARICTW